MKLIPIACCCATIAVAGWSAFRTDAPAETQLGAPESDQVESATIYGVGYVEPVTEVRRLSFDITGNVGCVHVAVGQFVPQGQPLMDLVGSKEAQDVKVAEHELMVERANYAVILRGQNDHRIAAAQYGVEACRKRLTFWELEYDRVKSLKESKAVTTFEIDKTLMQRDEARALLAQAEATLEYLKHFVLPEQKALAAEKVGLGESRLERLRTQLAKTQLVAPFDGTVLEILKREGEHVVRENHDPVIVFGDLSRLRVRGEIDERNANRVQVGQRVTVYGRNLGTASYPAAITAIKSMMGSKTVFSRTAAERRSLEVLQVFIDFDDPVTIPTGLRVDIAISCSDSNPSPGAVDTS